MYIGNKKAVMWKEVEAENERKNAQAENERKEAEEKEFVERYNFLLPKEMKNFTLKNFTDLVGNVRGWKRIEYKGKDPRPKWHNELVNGISPNSDPIAVTAAIEQYVRKYLELTREEWEYKILQHVAKPSLLKEFTRVFFKIVPDENESLDSLQKDMKRLVDTRGSNSQTTTAVDTYKKAKTKWDEFTSEENINVLKEGGVLKTGALEILNDYRSKSSSYKQNAEASLRMFMKFVLMSTTTRCEVGLVDEKGLFLFTRRGGTQNIVEYIEQL
jgi:hypothetical protein